MKAKYAICVDDANGWSEGCPDSEGVFFGDRKDMGGEYFRWVDECPYRTDHLPGGADSHGLLVVSGYREAHATMRRLLNEGDWVPPEEVNPERREVRPVYAVVRLS